MSVHTGLTLPKHLDGVDSGVLKPYTDSKSEWAGQNLPTRLVFITLALQYRDKSRHSRPMGALNPRRSTGAVARHRHNSLDNTASYCLVAGSTPASTAVFHSRDLQ